ncbi:hypothetical protein J3P88_00510 [Pseudomonas sp. Z3-6]|uniref:hypothetical protein n=1 Tax=Pseudomonas sp. Z3-6 TaxID=2817411 RepID=UPI003DA93331
MKVFFDYSRNDEKIFSSGDLTDIHRELEAARKQQHPLQLVADSWQRYQALQEQYMN